MRALWVVVLVGCGGSHVVPKQEVLAGRPAPASTKEAPPAGATASSTRAAADCATSIRAIKLFDRPTDPEWQETFRLRALDHLCTRQEWSTGVKECLRDASSESAGACIVMLDSRQMARIAEVVTRAKTIERLQATPAVISCDRVAEHVHSDPNVQRKMSVACTNERWSAPARACVIAGGHGYECPEAVAWSPWLLARELPTECHDLARAREVVKTCRSISQGDRDALDDWWSKLGSELQGEELGSFATDLPAMCDIYGFKARKKLQAVGCSLDPASSARALPPACEEYERVAMAAKTCSKLPQKMRDEVGTMPDWLELDGDEQAAMPASCALLVEKTRTAMTAVGC